MTDPDARSAAARNSLLPLEPLRRRVIRVYWMRGLLLLLLLGGASALAAAAALASALWMLRMTGGSDPGELALHLVPLLLALVVPPALIALGAFVLAAAIVRRFGRATVQDYDERFGREVVAPLLAATVAGARLDLTARVDDRTLDASGLFAAEQRPRSGAFLMNGSVEEVHFTVSTLDVRARAGRLALPASVFRGVVAEISGTTAFEGAALLSAGADALAGFAVRAGRLQPLVVGDPVFDECFRSHGLEPTQTQRSLSAPVRALLLDVLDRAAAPVLVSLHAGGMLFAFARPQMPFAVRRARPSDPEQLARDAELYALVARAARALGELPR